MVLRPLRSSFGSDRFRSARNGDDTGSRHVNQPQRLHQLNKRIDLVRGARDFEHEGTDRAVNHAGAKDVSDAQRFYALLLTGVVAVASAPSAVGAVAAALPATAAAAAVSGPNT